MRFANMNIRFGTIVAAILVSILVVLIVIGAAQKNSSSTDTTIKMPQQNTESADTTDSSPLNVESPVVTTDEESFLDRIYAFEEAYYTLDFDVKRLAYERIATQQYRDMYLDPSGDIDIVAKVRRDANSAPVVEYDGVDIAYVWTKSVIETYRGDKRELGPFEVHIPHETVWRRIDGQWYVADEA